MPDPSVLEFETAIEKLKGHTSPGNYQIPADLIKAGNRTIRSEIHKLINSIYRVAQKNVNTLYSSISLE